MFARHAIYGSITALLLGSASAHAASAAQDGAVTRAGAAPQDQENNGSPENAGGLEQIIVTAERREANVQKTPVAITALSGAALAEKQVADLTDLKAPAFVFAEVLGAARIYVRGIGYESLSPGSESRVALYNDGVYVGRPSAGLANFYDVERVEVLRGPQGTLYGRNATAGAVNIITVDPGRNLKGFVSATVGNYGLLKTEGGVTVPLSDKISTRLSFQTVDRDGYGKHIQTGAEIDDAHSRAARLKMNVAASDDVNILLSADYSKSNDNTGGLHYIRPGSPDIVPVGIANGFLPPENVRDYAGLGPKRTLEIYGVSGLVDWDIGDVTLTSQSAYRHTDSFTNANNDGLPSNYSRGAQTDNGRQFSQELRLAGDSGQFHFVGGAYYFYEKVIAALEVNPAGFLFGVPTTDIVQGYFAGGTLKTNAVALFGQASYEVTPDLKLTVGGRYSRETKKVDEVLQFDFSRTYDPNNPLIPLGTAMQKTKESSFDPRVALEYQVSDNVFAYASFSKGFKSGGFNVGNLQPAFKPEEITDYEVGLKTELFDGRLRANVTAFWYDYTNLQVSVIRDTALLTENAASAELKGFEVELQAAPTPELRLNASFSYLDGTYTKYVTADPTRLPLGPLDLSGNRLSYNPEFMASGEAAYTFRLGADDLTIRGVLNYQSKIFFSQFNVDNVSEDGYLIGDLFADYKFNDIGLTVRGFVKNVGDKTYISSAIQGPAWIGVPLVGTFNAPRTFGLEVRKTF